MLVDLQRADCFFEAVGAKHKARVAKRRQTWQLVKEAAAI